MRVYDTYYHMTTDHVQLAAKIAAFIAKHQPVTFTILAERAVMHGIDMHVFHEAMTIIHRSKKIATGQKGDDITYKITVEKPKTVEVASHITWLNDNYPRPSNFIMPFPEIDFSYLFLEPEEMKAYKAAMKGMPVHMMSKYA